MSHRKKGHLPVTAPSTDPLDQIYQLTIRESAFIQRYLACQVGALAAVQAGFSPRSAQQRATELLKKDHIQAALRARRQSLAIESGVTAQDVLNELKKVAFANMDDYMSVDDEGAPYLDLSTLTRDQAAAISEANTERYVEGKGKDAMPVKKAKVKLHDKISALVNLGKHLGLFADRQEHTGAGGGPIRWTVRLVPCPKPNQPAPTLIQ